MNFRTSISLVSFSVSRQSKRDFGLLLSAGILFTEPMVATTIFAFCVSFCVSALGEVFVSSYRRQRRRRTRLVSKAWRWQQTCVGTWRPMLVEKNDWLRPFFVTHPEVTKTQLVFVRPWVMLSCLRKRIHFRKQLEHDKDRQIEKRKRK